MLYMIYYSFFKTTFTLLVQTNLFLVTTYKENNVALYTKSPFSSLFLIIKKL